MKEAAPPTEFAVPIRREEVAEAFEPFVQQRFSDRDPEWLRQVGELEASYRKKREKRERTGQFRSLRSGDALPVPESQVASAPEWFRHRLGVEGAPALCRWGSSGMLAKGVGTSRIHLLLLIRTLETLRPASVLEVGCGSGTNLFVLSALFPRTRFTGLELDAAAVDRAGQIKRMDALPPVMGQYAPVPLDGGDAHRRIEVQQGSAAALPFRRASFDLVFTRLALEQMEAIRDAALSEVARVVRNHTVMVEPFREWNDEGLRRDYIVAQRYFAARVSDLAAHGLEPIGVYDDFPHKVILRPALVVARKR